MIEYIQASKSDIDIIRSISSVSFYDTDKNILSPEQLDWMYDWMYSINSLNNQFDSGQTFFIIKYNNVNVGFVSIERQAVNLFHIQKIYLLPEYKGLGLGKSLLNKAIDFIRSFNIIPSRIELNVNRNNKAKDFYMRMGFKIASQGDFAIGNGYYMNDYIMSYDIVN